MTPSESDELVPAWRVNLWLLRARLRNVPDAAAWWIARHLPRKIALYAFMRVYAVTNGVTATYPEVYRAWEQQTSALETASSHGNSSRKTGGSGAGRTGAPSAEQEIP